MVFKKFFGSKLGVYDWIAVILNLALVESIKEKWLHHGVLCNAQLQSLCYVLFRTYFRTSSSRRLTWKYGPISCSRPFLSTRTFTWIFNPVGPDRAFVGSIDSAMGRWDNLTEIPGFRHFARVRQPAEKNLTIKTKPHGSSIFI